MASGAALQQRAPVLASWLTCRMSRIFSALSVLAVILLLTNLLLGLLWGDFGTSSQRFQAARVAYAAVQNASDATLATVAEARAELTRQGQQMAAQRNRIWPHIWLGIVAALITLLVNSISVTYFIGTARWCAEVVDAYGLDPELAEKSRTLKRRSFPWALLGILTVLSIAALGAASDPYASTADPSSWVTLHWLAALAGTVLIGMAFYFQSHAVGANYGVIESILEEVGARRARAEAASEPVSTPASTTPS